jgi:hypothetical protein
LFTDHPPSDIIFLSDRINFNHTWNRETEPLEMHEQIGGMIAYCWVVWDKKATGTNIQWVLLEDLYPDWRENYKNKTGL